MSDIIGFTPKRFKKVAMKDCLSLGGKIKNWPDEWPESNVPLRTARFLSKIWSLYGPPCEITYEGFEYCFKDSLVDIYLSVYCGATGPAFGATTSEWIDSELVYSSEKAKIVNDSVTAFEYLLAAASLADCEVIFDTDFGLVHVGCKNGELFEVETGSKL
ncbi:MAG: hypothetical protein H6670_17265 [Anaerolineaceae bacterium]|nr:hypothetical protein [Anaerolineaceae bacterium]